MQKQTLEDFLATGGKIQKVSYSTFSATGEVPTFGMRKLIEKHKMSVYVGRKGKNNKKFNRGGVK